MDEKEKMILEFMEDKEYVPMKVKEIAMILNIPKEKNDELVQVLNNLEEKTPTTCAREKNN